MTKRVKQSDGFKSETTATLLKRRQLDDGDDTYVDAI